VKTAFNDVRKSESCGRKSIRKLSVLSMIALVSVSCLILSSCAGTGKKRQEAFDKVGDDYLATITEIKKNHKKLYGEKSEFLLYMDIGVLFHYAGMYDSSNVYLLKAEQIFDDLFTRSVTNEAAALLTNDNMRPYRTKPYELTVLHQLAAFNFMAMGKFDEALVETRRMQTYFNEWERTEAKDKKYHTDGMFHLFSSLAYERVNEPDNSLISLFKSVEAYKKGPVALAPEVEGFAYDRLKAGEREDDIGTLKIGPNSGSNKWTAAMGDAEIIIVGYAGKGPKMIEQNWEGDMVPGGNMSLRRKGGGGQAIVAPAPPIPDSHKNSVKGGGPTHLKISLPELVTTESRIDRFSARLAGGGQEYRSVVVNDIDKQAKKEFDDNFGTVVARTMLRTFIRTMLAEQTKKNVSSNNSGANFAIGLIANAVTAEMEHADVRMCFFLPQKIIVTRIPVEPGTYTVQMNVHDKSGSVIGRRSYDNIEVKKGDKKVLFNKQL